jgi:hypothetical protein
MIFITLILAWIVFVILFKVVKMTVKTAFTVAAILVLLHLVFGITPQDIWNQIMQLPQTLSKISGGK